MALECMALETGQEGIMENVMSKYLVGLQTIQTGASRQGGQVVKYQLGSHLIRKGTAGERHEVEQKKISRIDPDAIREGGQDYGGNTLSLMVAGVMDTCIPLSDFLGAIWVQNALVASNAPDHDREDEVFSGAFEISTPKADTAALNLLLYYHKSEQEKMERLATAVEAKILPGMAGMASEGIALAGQVLPSERVKRRVTADREYLYGSNEFWGAYAIKIRFPRSNEFKGYQDGGACLGIHLDDMSSLPYERIVRLVTELRTIGMHDVERASFHDQLYDNQMRLEAFHETLSETTQRTLHDIVTDVICILNVQTIYDRQLARSRDFWKKVKGI